jgi:hypothetical protein
LLIKSISFALFTNKNSFAIKHSPLCMLSGGTQTAR